MNTRRTDIVSDQQLVAHIKKHYIYDAQAGVVRNRRNGRAIKGFNSNSGYLYLDIRVDGHRSSRRLHHVVWVLNYGAFPVMIDHINGNPKDNRIENLRECNQSENDQNRVWRWKPNALTGLPGVHYCKRVNYYSIKIGNRYYYFRDKYEAFYTLTMFGRMFSA